MLVAKNTAPVAQVVFVRRLPAPRPPLLPGWIRITSIRKTQAITWVTVSRVWMMSIMGNAFGSGCGSGLGDGREACRIQRGPANQGAVDVRRAEQPGGIVGLDAASVQDTGLARKFGRNRGQTLADRGV